MAIRTERVRLGIRPCAGEAPVVCARQGDAGMALVVEVSGEGGPVDLSGASAVLVGNNPELVAVEGSVDGGAATFVLPSAAFSRSGTYRAHVRLSRDGAVASTLAMLVRVLPGADLSAGQAQGYVPLLDELAGRAESALADADAASAAAAAAAARADAAAEGADGAAGRADAAAERADAAAERAESAAGGAGRSPGNFLRGRAEGAVARTDDAWPGPVLLAEVPGASAQPSSPGPISSVSRAALAVAGRNLMPAPTARSGESNGVSFRVLDDGGVAFEGAPEGGKVAYFYPFGTSWSSAEALFTLRAGTYTVSAVRGSPLLFGMRGRPPGGEVATIAGASINSPQASVRTFELAEDTEVTHVQFTLSGAGRASGVQRVQVERGRAATAYEPYAPPALWPADLRGNELRGLPDGTRDALLWAGDGTLTLLRRVGRTSTAASDGVEGEVGSSAMSSTGAIEDGADVLFRLAEPAEVPLGRADPPVLPGAACSVWAEADVPAGCAVEFERDVTAAFSAIESRLVQAAAAVGA